MNQKKKVKPKTPQPTYSLVCDIKVGARMRHLVSGIDVKLIVKPGRKPGRYRFEQAEIKPDGTILLHVYGPLRRDYASMRYVSPNDVVSVHKPIVAKALKDDGSTE